MLYNPSIQGTTMVGLAHVAGGAHHGAGVTGARGGSGQGREGRADPLV